MNGLTIEMINTGTELLLGSVVNTNAAWMGERLFERGLRLARQVTVPDGAAIFHAMEEASGRADVVLVTGGLGPTSDDVTREALARLFDLELRVDASVLDRLKQYFETRGRTMSPSNERQAMVLPGCRVLPNANGTAPGLWMPPSDRIRSHVVLLPGPPRELCPMAVEQVIPQLALLARCAPSSLRVVKMVGIGESDLQDLADAGLHAVDGLEFGYCARLGEVDVRLIGEADTVERATGLLEELAGGYMVRPFGATLEEAVVLRLSETGRTVATAESCTGGLIAKRLTDVSGASDVFHSGYVTYANEAKERMLGVPASLLEQYGAVSEPVARAMAEGALARSGADVAMAVTGIAGPTGGTDEKPVGTVWTAWAFRDAPTEARRSFFPVGREAFRFLVSQQALSRLLKA